MKFKTKAQEKAYKNVRKYIKEAFGDETFKEMSERPVFIGAQGSAMIQITTIPWGNDDAVIAVGCCCVHDIELVPDLLEYLLKENYTFRFGAFSLDKDGDICFEHSITGASLDKNELVASVKAVAGTADKYDDEIIRRWGGVTGVEKLKQQLMDHLGD